MHSHGFPTCPFLFFFPSACNYMQQHPPVHDGEKTKKKYIEKTSYKNQLQQLETLALGRYSSGSLPYSTVEKVAGTFPQWSSRTCPYTALLHSLKTRTWLRPWAVEYDASLIYVTNYDDWWVLSKKKNSMILDSSKIHISLYNIPYILTSLLHMK